MKAIQISKNGGPEVLELKDIKLNKPEKDEVTIEHKAIGLNYKFTQKALRRWLGIAGKLKSKRLISARICSQKICNFWSVCTEGDQKVLFAFSNFFNECDKLWMITVFKQEHVGCNTIK